MKQPRICGAGHGVALAALSLALGCANDLSTSLEGKPCSKSGACLTGYTCVADVCVSTASTAAGGRPASGGNGGASSGGAPPDASSTGGAASSGGAATGGTDGGMTGEAGPGEAGGNTGDASTGGVGPVEAGAGGAAPAEAGAGGAGGVLNFTGTTCDDGRCDTDEVCCVSDYPGFPTAPLASAFSCRGGSSGCEYALSCDGAHDCPSALTCCGTQVNGDWRVACMGNCGTAGGVQVECTREAHCGAGEVCCGTWSTQLNHYRSILCETSCAGNRLCGSEAECDSDETCTRSSSIPGFGLCL